MSRGGVSASEVVLWAMACLSPWAFGAVEAWAEFALAIGVALLALLGVIGRGGGDRRRALTCLPSVALAGLVLLALFQATPLPEGLLRALSPGTAALRRALLPREAERVVGDPGPPVPLPSATLSQDPEATLHMAVGLAAAWVVIQGVLGLRDGGAALRRFGLAVSANAALLALYSLVQALTWNGKIYWWRASPSGSAGPFVCHSHLAAYLNLGLGLTLSFLLTPARDESGGRGRNLWAAYAAGMIVAGIVVSLSRSAFLGMSAAAVGLFLLLRPRGVRTWTALGTLAVLVPILLMVMGRSIPYQGRLATLLTSSAYSARTRIWRDALRAWPIYPVWGTGLGSFSVAAAPYFRHAAGVKYVHAENEYVEWLVEGGAVGLVLGTAGVVGVVRLGRRAWESSANARDRALILGASFGGISLLVQSGGDFASHIPAVGVTAVILAALVVGRGLEAANAPRPRWRWGWGPRAARLPVAELALAVAGLIVLVHGALRARSEASFFAAGVSLQDNGPLIRSRERFEAGDVATTTAAGPELERMRVALEQSLRVRPDWAEGHLRLGLVLLHGYERRASEALSSRVADPSSRALLASPLWLHGVIHSSPAGPREATAELIDFEPIRAYLIPAARSFLEARRCGPVLPLPHAELAALDFLIEGGDPGALYAERALRLAGANGPLIALVTQLAVQLDARDLAARGLRQSLLTEALGRDEVADLAGGVLAPGQILREVVPDGRTALAFADRLFAAPEDRDVRRTFLEAALGRLPRDRALGAAERLELEAQVWERLEQRGRARQRLEAALAIEPYRARWRKDLVTWLVAWGRPREAHDQALIGLQYAPEHPDSHAALELAAEALARGTPPAPSPKDDP